MLGVARLQRHRLAVDAQRLVVGGAGEGHVAARLVDGADPVEGARQLALPGRVLRLAAGEGAADAQRLLVVPHRAHQVAALLVQAAEVVPGVGDHRLGGEVLRLRLDEPLRQLQRLAERRLRLVELVAVGEHVAEVVPRLAQVLDQPRVVGLLGDQALRDAEHLAVALLGVLGAPFELEHLPERAQRQPVAVAALGRTQVDGHLLVVALRLVGHLVEQVEAAERAQPVDQVFEHEGGEALGLRPRLLGAVGRLLGAVRLPRHAGGEQAERRREGGADEPAQPPPRPADDPAQPFQRVERRRPRARRQRLHAAEERREVGIDAGDRRRVAAQRLVEALADRPALARRLAGEELLQDEAERVDVARRRRLLALRLLGAHVVDGAGDAADGEQQLAAHHRLAVDERRQRPPHFGRRLLLGAVRQTEVEDLRLPFRREDDVLGLQVAVDDALTVRRRDRRQQLIGDAQLVGLAVERALAARLPQRLAGHQLEDDDVAVARLEVVVDEADVGVMELREDLRLAEQARARHGLEAFVLAQHLDGDAAAELLVPRLVDEAHAAAAQRRHDAQGSDLLSYELVHGRSLRLAGVVRRLWPGRRILAGAARDVVARQWLEGFASEHPSNPGTRRGAGRPANKENPVRRRDLAFLGIALATMSGRAVAVPAAGEPAIEITRADSAAGRALRLTLSLEVAPSWREANVAFLALRSGGRQNAVDHAKALGRDVDVTVPELGCAMLVADLGRPEDRGFADSWQRTRRSTKAVLCRDSGEPAQDLAARRRAGAVLLARAGTRDEVRPLANPATTRPGADLPLKLYADGDAAAGVEVVAQGPDGTTTTVKSDAHGFATVSLTAAGPWRIWFRTGERVAELLFEVPGAGAQGGAR